MQPNQAWATYSTGAGAGPQRGFDQPADCIQPYPGMWPEASFMTIVDRYAVTELPVRACGTKTCLISTTVRLLKTRSQQRVL